MRTVILLTLFAISGISEVCAQATDSTKLVQVVTTDGNEYIGVIVSENPSTVQLDTRSLGLISIPRRSIKSISPVVVQQMKGDEYWYENFQSTRYFFAPNGYGLKKGEAYYQNTWIFFNQFSVGLTKNFSVGGGIMPLFLFGGAPTPVWLTPKFSIPVSKDRVNIAAGALIGTVLGSEDYDEDGSSGGSGFGQLYGMVTLGSRDKNFNFGLGYGYSAGELASTPTITFGGMIRTGQRGYFITENYILDTGDVVTTLLSFGGRRLIKRSGIDFGLVIPVSSDIPTFVAIPWLGITVPLNK